MDCVFIDEGYCSAAAVELDPDTGCATYSPTDAAAAGDDWDKDKEDELDEWEDEEEEDDELWEESEDDI
jgi:hypothetical protein